MNVKNSAIRPPRVRYALLTMLCCASTIGAISIPVASVHAQAADPANAPDGEIIVTARKREEAAINVPAAITAIGSKDLERRNITGVDNLSAIVPQLIVGEGGGSIQGGIISLRGIGSGESNPLVDQAVSFNVDGVPVARATVRRLSQMDLAQVEVLRGPQALFFGKNSPGGIISMRTADPTSTFQAQVSAGYEFNANNKQVQGYISAPISDNFGVRVAFLGDEMSGWVKDGTPKTNPLAPAYSRLPRSKEYAGRLTLKYTGDRFNLRIKISGDDRKGAGPAANMQLIACPVGGVPQGAATGECVPDNRQSHVDMGTAFLSSANPSVARVGQLIGGSIPYMNVSQVLASAEMNYNLNDQIKLTSVTGFYKTNLKYADNFKYNNDIINVIPNTTFFRTREFNQELRLSTDFEMPVNFMVGGLYSHSLSHSSIASLRGGIAPTFLGYSDFTQKGEAWSVFAQARWNIIPTLELSGGGRYSHEKKELTKAVAGASFAAGIPPIPKKTWNNFSPEATLAWHPTNNLTLFGSYKRGFLSGGFNAGATSIAALLPYDEQKIKGFETGIKGRLLGGHLRTNLVYYDYITTGLAITTSQNSVLTTVNAGRVKLRGIEFDANYTVPNVDGLTLRGSVGWEHARYAVYSVSCWTGQTPAQGCNQALNAAQTAYTLQNLAGTQLLRAPDWTGTLGMSYEAPLSAHLKAGLHADANYSGEYVTDAQAIPFAHQKSFTKFDLSATLADRDDRWEAAIVGKNITNEYTIVRAAINPFTGSGTGTAAGIPPDVAGSVSRGREVWLRFTLKFGK